ncbi:MAG: SPOR domain-containing protein [Brumimicrobium sp.]
MKLCYILITLTLFFKSFAFSQEFTDNELDALIETASEEELVEINTILNFEESYYQAERVANKLLKFQPDNPNYNYRKGFASFKSNISFNDSKPYFEKAVINVSKKYDLLSTKEERAPFDALYYMGRCYHLSNELDKAIDFYQSYLDNAKKNEDLRSDAELKIKQCGVAKKLLEEKDDEYYVENLGSTINSSFPDYSPVISLDGFAIYYTSRRLREDSSNIDIVEPGTNMHLEDIYVSKKDYDDNWTEPQLMDFCDPEKNEATVAVSTDERRIYVYKDETGNGDIYFSDFEASEFKELEILEDQGVNTDNWEPHITVSPDGQQKYFSSDREGGYGGRDIYRIIKLPDGNWSEPKNLGPNINTEYDEDAPFLAVDNKRMYYASNGPKSMGGFDIFMTERDENNVWSTPKNLGYPLNTTSDDIYYTTTVDGLTGYLTSFRPDGEGEKDIYEIKNNHLGIENAAVLKGEIETKNGDPIPEDVAFTLRCIDCEEQFDIEFFPRISDGTFIASLVPCHEYKLIVHHNKGEDEIHQETFNTECSEGFQEVYRHIMLDVNTMSVIDQKDLISSYPPISMKHYFGYNNNKLDPNKGALKTFLDSLEIQMSQGRTNIYLTINSSASKVTTKTFKNNRELAETRAKKLNILLDIYFSQKENTDSIEITINDIQVSGPEYRSDYTDVEKYIPYQYVSVSLEGVNSISEDMIAFESKDQGIKNIDASNGQISNGKVSTDSNGDTFTSGEVIESDYKFHVIVGVFRRMSNAEGMVRSAKNQGFDAEIIGKRNGLNVVSVGSSNSFNEIKSILSRAREEVIESAWILN